jgi:lipopolysaccharide transport system ATP-binding protein
VTARPGTPVLELRDVWRRYRVATEALPRTLKAAFARRPAGQRRGWFWALRGVDLAVRPGTATALVGPNGAGKSTLLRLAGGVGRPDKGSVRVHGRVGALLDLGREFHPDLTGLQNAELAAVVAGMTRAGFARRVDEILDFAGLAAFADQPLHAYSDGMRARLAFSVLAHVEPDVLLVDEVLAVGDAAFQRRSVERIDELRARGTAVVLVSHDLSLVRRVCDEAAWLDGGAIRSVGAVEDVVADYLAASAATVAEPLPVPTDGPLRAARILDAWGAPTATVPCGGGLVVAMEVDVPTDVGPVHLSVKLRRAGAGTVAVDTSTPCRGGPEDLHVAFERLDLAPGAYDVVVAMFGDGWSTRLDERRSTIRVEGEGPDGAVLAPPHEWHRGAPA